MKHGVIGCKSIVLRLTEVLYVTYGLVSYLCHCRRDDAARVSKTSTGVEKTTNGINVRLTNTSTLFNTAKRKTHQKSVG